MPTHSWNCSAAKTTQPHCRSACARTSRYCLQFNSQFIKARPNAGFLFTLLKVQQREVCAHALLQCGCVVLAALQFQLCVGIVTLAGCEAGARSIRAAAAI